jgi:predicted DNA-binding transcriptional regulator AlpA
MDTAAPSIDSRSLQTTASDQDGPHVARKMGAMNNPKPPNELGQLALSPTDAARLLGVSRATFFKMHSSGKLPMPVYLTPRTPRWVKAELVAWLTAGAPDRLTWTKLWKEEQ